ncbi:TetR/AcrR family transcriptional regulator [Sinomonas albida]|uniref:TetR/AcrR family transcriptional regulator n=1 Tax=Sinomonas albida TaxID=369942 RepID=UPI001457A24C|nr:TetR/AcrR family transcriptional regulator [Sinomonas albida]
MTVSSSPSGPPARSPRGPYKKGIERRREVVSVAIEVFGQHGFKGGTLQQVAERVGLTPAAVLKLFGSKEGLLIAVLEHWDVVTRQAMGSPQRGYGLLEAFRKLMHYHTQHRGLLELYTTMAAEATSAEHPAHEFMTGRYRATLESMRRLFYDAIEDGHFRPMAEEEIDGEAECLLATMDGLEIQFLLNPAFDLERSFGAFLDRLVARLSA